MHPQKSGIVVGLWSPLRATCWLESMKSSSLISANRSNSNLFCGSLWAFVLAKAGSKACLFTARPNRGILPWKGRTISEVNHHLRQAFALMILDSLTTSIIRAFALLFSTDNITLASFYLNFFLFHHHDPLPPTIQSSAHWPPLISPRILKRPSVRLQPSRWSQSRSVARLGHLFIKQEQWHWVRGRDKQPMKRHERSSTC